MEKAYSQMNKDFIRLLRKEPVQFAYSQALQFDTVGSFFNNEP